MKITISLSVVWKAAAPQNGVAIVPCAFKNVPRELLGEDSDIDRGIGGISSNLQNQAKAEPPPCILRS